MLSHKKKNCPKACKTAHEAGQKVREIVDTTTAEIEDAKAFAVKQIRRDPLGTAVIIASAAFVLGKLLARRR